MVALRSLSLERLGQVQASAVLVASALVVLVGHPWPVAVAAVLGACLLLVAWRGRYTPRGSFGLANAISAFRLVCVLWLATLGSEVSTYLVPPLVLSLMLLDGLDGFVARRLGTASEFGAHWDVEADALLVLTLGLMLWERERLGAWALWPGLLRYGYVVLLGLVPGRGQEPRSRTGRIAFFVTVFGLTGAFVDGGGVAIGGAVLATVVITLSFARSLYYSYRASVRSP
jgi:phosphatidylglycerophosphate synthase